MILDRWRAQRAIATRSAPTPVTDSADPRLLAAVEAIKPLADAPNSLGDPSWHYRWEGGLQLVGLDCRTRSVTDLRQRLLRLVHECDLRHLSRPQRRVLGVVLCEPQGTEGLRGWHQRLEEDRDEVGTADWRAARGRIAVLAIDATTGARELFGAPRALEQSLAPYLAG
ncbi:MAG: hypothetical protein ACT4PU_07710 [Planctomycetota bacterium]